MPKPSLKNPFARRRSSGNILDYDPASQPAAPAQSSFRVIERPEKSNAELNGFKVNTVQRPFSSPLQHLKGKSADDLTYAAASATRAPPPPPRNATTQALKPARGSAGTTHSVSSDQYQSSTSTSARHSSTSTLPSSLDQDQEPEDKNNLFANTRRQHTMPLNNFDAPIPAPPPSFASRAARTFSFGMKSKQPQSPVDTTAAHVLPPPTASADYKTPAIAPEPARERALTTSSYASTAVPLPILDTRPALTASDFGNDFGSMFADMSQDGAVHESPAPSPLPPSHRTESAPMFPPRSYSRQGALPSPNGVRNARESAESPYAWDRRSSHDALISSNASSPRAELGGIAPAFLPSSAKGYSLVPERYSSPAPERTSDDSQPEYMANRGESRSPEFANRQSHLDDDNRWPKQYELRDPPQPSSNNATRSIKSTSTVTPSTRWGGESSNTTPKATKSTLNIQDDEPLFDISPAGPASRAKKPAAPAPSTSESTTPKRLTKAQFEILQRHGDKNADSTENDGDSGEEYDDEDEVERAKQVTRQRRKQDANMAVYRQQMKKVAGGGPTDLPLPRPGLDRASSSIPQASSASSLYLGGMPGSLPPDAMRGGKQGDDDEDDDTPLAILQAHGFPSSTRPPTRLAGEEAPQIRRASTAVSVTGAATSQNLPPFARRLPEDPYFGAGLVNQGARESLGFGAAGSVYGGSAAPSVAQTGGLVGVIANEERQRQARRGSPNPVTGTYSMPLPGNMTSANRSSSMVNLAPPHVYSPTGGQQPIPMMMPGMPGMPNMPPMGMMDNPQMQQFMQMQMQFMQNMQSMMQMQQSQMGQAPMPPPHQQNNFLGPPGNASRPQLSVNQPGRAMTMTAPPSMWRPNSSLDQRNSVFAPSVHGLGGPGPAYTPSIAPSERSNIGMPSRYRPVQTDDGASRTHSLTSSQTLNAFQNQQATVHSRNNSQETAHNKSTIRIIDKPKGAPKVSSRQVDVDEDDEEGWAEMAKKRKEKKFRWTKQKDTPETTLGDIYHALD